MGSFWDTSGLEVHRSLNQSFYRGVGLAFVVFDLSNATTFSSIENWISELRRLGTSDKTAIVLVGNKRDLW